MESLEAAIEFSSFESSPRETRAFPSTIRARKSFNLRSVSATATTHARASSVELEKTTGITQRVIRYRIAELEKKGIIVGYKLAINYRQLGFLFFKCFITFRNLTNEQYMTFREYVRTSPNIIYWIKTIGSWDAELEIESASVEDYYALISEIKSRFAPIILRIDSTLVSKEHIINHV